jgi:hypothetical protein
MDAQDTENFRTHYPNLKIANNIFKIVKGVVLEFGGRRNSLLFFVIMTKGSCPNFERFSFVIQKKLSPILLI